MDKFKNKYRIPSARLQHWDYRWAASYFITICCHKKECYFGEIIDTKMQMTHIGVIADILWYQITHHARNIELGAFVVMPNHVHGIVIITQYDNDKDANTNDTHIADINGKYDYDNVEKEHALPLQPQPTIGQQRFQNIGKNSISSIVGSYKSAVTKHAHRLGFDYQWQTGFHEHIIRNADSFQQITNYILNNPTNWSEDKFFKAKNSQ